MMEHKQRRSRQLADADALKILIRHVCLMVLEKFIYFYQVYQIHNFWGFLVNHHVKSTSICSGGCANPWCICQALISQRCSLGANWQACDFIMTGKYSAFLPPNWKCQCRGAILSNSYWNVVIQSQWLIRAINTFYTDLQRVSIKLSRLHSMMITNMVIF